MLLYLLRHGIAEDHGARASDEERELTEEGIEKTTLVMRAAKKMRLETPQLIISSPLVRAKQTAAIAHKEFGALASTLISETLVPSADLSVTMSLVAEHIKEHAPVMLVGHEPHLSSFATALLGSTSSMVEMKKAALAAFELHRLDPIRMRGVLTALIPPKIANLL
jgi:phosphohistidine phosphatase